MFIPYMHVERLGSDEVAGLLSGQCYVFPKIDGTNASVWWEDDQLCAASRNRQLTAEQDNAGFFAFVQENRDAFQLFFGEFPNLRIYGEFLVPHTLRTYRPSAWRMFYVFDVYDHDLGRYLNYPEYSTLADVLPFPIIAPLEIVTNPTEEHLTKILDRNTYLIEDGNGVGEGIVIKRYDFVNQWGRTIWGKIVRNEFKERNMEAFGTPTVAMKGSLEDRIAFEYVVRPRIEKTIEKMRDIAPLTRQRIPELFWRVWHEIINDEMWEIVKANKNPIIDFKRLNQCVIEQIKNNCPELFG